MPAAAVDCPKMLHGEFNYTVTDGGVSSCGANSSWDGCSDRDTPSVNTTLCDGDVAFSGK
ncbi:hypothetical protein DPMN_035215 [Dreissena polymorpha]|uniref:Uncharacterized protein n=1 Tax=Dreissena polymorpha TaxID=45954 RepID=A0A9D4M6W1_DREPO|nr:hypothetical protein DPMN_035215 [Dreissena polymorpha]